MTANGRFKGAFSKRLFSERVSESGEVCELSGEGGLSIRMGTIYFSNKVECPYFPKENPPGSTHAKINNTTKINTTIIPKTFALRYISSLAASSRARAA